MVTNQQRNNRQPGLKQTAVETAKKTAAQKAESERVHAANAAEVRRSVNEWRAMQGLPLLEDTHGNE